MQLLMNTSSPMVNSERSSNRRLLPSGGEMPNAEDIRLQIYAEVRKLNKTGETAGEARRELFQI